MSAKLCKYTYFYILDHLGSTSMVLDVYGNISQSVTYIPYGEVFVEERNGAWNLPYLFNSKELDEETGFYYYGARYLNPTSGVWLSVDPLFEKYVGMSPYNYCAGNPVKLVDVDGRKIDISGLTEEQAVIYNDNITAQREGSPLFNKLYTALENSEIVYPIKVGETLNDVDGQFNKKDNSITFSDINNSAETAVIAEELFHAFQLSENAGKYGEGDFNYEFEAKVFTTAVGWEYGGYADIDGAKEFQKLLENLKFGKEETFEILIYQKVHTEEFFSIYKDAANEYGKFNIENNIGNINYKKTTNVKPFSLIEITK